MRSALTSARPDDPVADDERQHVVAVPPLGRRLVDLDQVPEPEHALGERPVPEQVVERREEDGAGRLRSLNARRPPAISTGGPPSSTASRRSAPRRHERVDVRLHPRHPAPQAPVLDHARRRSARRGPPRPAARAPASSRPRPGPARRAPRPGSPARAGRTCRWNPSRAPMTSRPADHSASSICLAGFRLHIPPAVRAPSKWRDPSGPRSRISPMMRSASAGSRSMRSPHHG